MVGLELREEVACGEWAKSWQVGGEIREGVGGGGRGWTRSREGEAVELTVEIEEADGVGSAEEGERQRRREGEPLGIGRLLEAAAEDELACAGWAEGVREGSRGWEGVGGGERDDEKR